MNVKVRDGLWAAGALLLALVTLFAPLGRPVHWWLIVASALWAAALVPISARWPRWAIVLTSPLNGVNNLLAIAPTSLVVFRSARSVRSQGQLWALVGVTAVLQAAFGGLHAWRAGDSFTEYLLGTLFSVFFLLVFPAVSGALIGRRKPLTQVLMERNDYLEHARALTASTARSATRAHIASEMHDMLSHRLRQLTAHAGALEHSAAEQAPELREQVELIRKTSAVAMEELREILGVLGASTEHAEDAGTRADVERLVAASAAAGLTVHLDWTGSDLADADARLRRAVHRVVREALTNVHKHAPSARTLVSVAVADRVRVEVVNGPSGEPRGAGTRRGLIGLEERVGLIGGSFLAEVPTGAGFRVTATLPLHPVVQEETGAASAVTEAPPPITAEILTVPRVVGSGCLATLSLVPALGTAFVLLVVAIFGRGEITRQEFDAFQPSVTHEQEVTETYGFGVLSDHGGCFRYHVKDTADRDFELCFDRESGLMTSKKELAR
ncbi:histidine kinase [Lentzea sp. BCCO 10_0061]|uniref:histidine kinase n=1 Tax=Lentzea sokolovensis TaxID=3095429 RepID=A0ABU4UZ66_9PSEU|nr:histidine kinase [Lentzea sp. BCCO 10_0061]MDX8144801.1 histidine kinase [Lentzea sp. BCCO 10_0061]